MIATRVSSRWAVLLICAFGLISCRQSPPTEDVMTSTPSTVEPTESGEATPPPSITRSLIPLPASVTWGEGSFTLSAETAVYVQPHTDELIAIGEYLADKLRPATGYP